MRILFLSQRVPFPPNRGDKIPNYHYIRHLSQNHDVVVACLADGREDLENVAGLSSMVEAVDAVPLSRTGSRLRALSALATGNRSLTAACFDEPELRRVVRNRLAESSIDLAFVASSGMASHVEHWDGPKIIQFTDLDSQKWRMYSKFARAPKRWVYQTEAKRLLEDEKRIAQAFDYSLFCSQREVADFRRLIPGMPVRCIRNGVNLDHFRQRDAAKAPFSLVFTGVMNYWPNMDGVVWFCREVLPIIQADSPQVSFTICGTSPTRPVRELERMPGVRVTGAVPDVRHYLAEASVGVVPIRMARGIQNKLLEAMAMGLPTVTTTAAFAGLEAENGRELLVADRPADFAAAVVRLLRDDDLRGNMGRAARACMEKYYQWDRSLADLDEVIATVMSRSNPPASQPATVGVA
jgi:sugar transferase (PEP-CTERM/EpsH1 system associated)